jgi:folate-binding protein YgfZ
MSKILNPLVAQRQILAGKALVRQENLSAISVAGEDRLTWLHSLLSQNIKNLTPGQSTQACLLDPQGHVEQLISVVDDGETAWLLVATESAPALMGWLTKMVFRMKVTVQDRTAELPIVASWGRPIELEVPVVSWTDGWVETASGGYRYGQTPTEPWDLVLNLIPAQALSQLEASGEWGSPEALEALRIAAHRPTAAEVDAKTLPHELDLLASAVHLNKGCYRGQETVAKVHNLGHPPRRLVLLHLDGSGHTLPYVGDTLALASDFESVKGRITTVGQHFEMGPIALAVVSRNTPLDATLVALGEHEAISGTQEVIVPMDAGKTVDVPKLPRLLMGGKK